MVNKENFDKKTMQEAQLKLAEKRAKQGELDSIKGSVKMISDALILLNNKMETLKNTNLKNVEDAIANFEEITDYHNKKIDNYDNNFNIIKRKINSFNDVAADMLTEIKSVCESLEVENIQEISKQTEEYADIIKNKIREISLEFDSFNDVQDKMEKIHEYVDNIESHTIGNNINTLLESVEKIQNLTDAFDGNISNLDDKVRDSKLLEKANERIKAFDKIYDSVNNILDKTGSINKNIKLAESTINNICKHNEQQNNNIEEILQNKFALLSQIIMEISEKLLVEKGKIEEYVGKKYSNINEHFDTIISLSENNSEMLKNAIENNTNNVVEDIKSLVSNSNTLVEQKFIESKNITNDLREELMSRYETLDKLADKIQSDSAASVDSVKNIISTNYEEILETINDMNKSQDETINNISELLIKNFKDVLENVHDVVCKNEKKYLSIIEKVDELAESINVLDNDVSESLNNNFKEIYNKLNDLTDENLKLKEEEEKKYKNLNERFEQFSFDTTKNFKSIKNKVNEFCDEIPKQINDRLKEMFSQMDEKLTGILENKCENIEASIEKINNKIIERDEFNNKFDKVNKLDSKICELEQKINDLLEENKNLKESINQNNLKLDRYSETATNNNSVAGRNESINILERAANNGDVNACLQLGNIYYQGLNTKQDFEKALKYYEIGSKRGNAECNSRIIAIYKMLADKGVVKYQFLTGKSYLEGKIVEQDLDTALMWYKKAAMNGNVEAKVMLMRMYNMMANNNNPDGLYNLGLCYYEGFCVEKDLSKAYEYFNRAASLGHAGAINMVKR